MLVLGLWSAASADDGFIEHLVQMAKASKKDGVTGYDLIEKVEAALRRHEGSSSLTFGKQFIDAVGNINGKAELKEWKKLGLPEDHFRYFDKDSDGLLDVHEAAFWFWQWRPARTMNTSEVHNPPRGHLQRLGSWKDPLPSDDLIYHRPFPHPRDFWTKHMDNYLPALLKGAQAGWPCMNWTREVLTEKFGWVDAKLEPKVEGRQNQTAYSDLEAMSRNHRLNISEYLRLEKDRNVYVVSVIPQVMAWEVAHPASLLCGSRRIILDKESPPPYKTRPHLYPHESGHKWMTHIFEANLWMASGKTRSQLHYDKEWNVNCLLSGKKRWFFLNPFQYDEDLPWARGNKFRADNPLNNRWTDWVYLDPDHTDLIVQHKLRQMDYYELVQEAGDCVFIPYAMLHQVEKLDDGLQVAVSWMFLPETLYSDEDCSEAPLEEDLPLAAMDTLFMYSGKGVIPQGYGDPLHLLQKAVNRMKQLDAKHFSYEMFRDLVTKGESILSKAPSRIRPVYNLIAAFGKDPAKGPTVKELKKVPLRIWAKPAAEGDEEGPLSCDVGEEYINCGDEEFVKMENFVQERLRQRGERPTDGPKPISTEPLMHRRVWTQQEVQKHLRSREEL